MSTIKMKASGGILVENSLFGKPYGCPLDDLWSAVVLTLLVTRILGVSVWDWFPCIRLFGLGFATASWDFLATPTSSTVLLLERDRWEQILYLTFRSVAVVQYDFFIEIIICCVQRIARLTFVRLT